ncbi:MAG TPA: hypothetical protein VF418_06135 [Sphingomonadaceae bacterium]
MTSKLVIGLAASALGIGALGIAGGAAAQVTTTSTTHMDANGAVHTTTTNSSPGGTKSIRTVDRPDGTRVVTRTATDNAGDARTVKHEVGSNEYKVCHRVWRHGVRVRRCTTHYR